MTNEYVKLFSAVMGCLFTRNNGSVWLEKKKKKNIDLDNDTSLSSKKYALEAISVTVSDKVQETRHDATASKQATGS